MSVLSQWLHLHHYVLLANLMKEKPDCQQSEESLAERYKEYFAHTLFAFSLNKTPTASLVECSQVSHSVLP